MRKKRVLTFIPMLVLISFLLTSCFSQTDMVKVRESFADKASGNIIVSVVWPISELKSDTGFVNGANMAIEEINSNKGVQGRLLEAKVMDEKLSFREGMLSAQEIASQKDVAAIIGHWEPYISLPAAKIYNDSGLLFLSPAVSSDELTTQGYDYVFRNTLSDYEMGSQMAEYISNQGLKRAVIFYEDDDYGKAVAKAFESNFIESDGEIVDRVTDFSNELEFEKAYEKWLALDYDAVFIVDSMPHAGVFLKRLRKVDQEVPIFAADGLDLKDLPTLLGEVGEGMFVATTYNNQDSRRASKQFRETYEEKFGIKPDTWAVQGYDSIKLIAYAIDQAQGTDPIKLASTLHNTKNWNGVIGTISFDKDGNMTGKDISMKVIKNGRYKFVGFK